ncbi:NADH-ubiquinone oxidoreductase subunit B17.2 [Drepanopeziza brunnea f. sp. 'multigermtubi' MB_m1]|uniref:NADH dehydrogenase [ubiquinone] 1 alpha subcomplex subunit n=1 Tax=Marssonina brunnea f. sp. multigermtubi (strain MB_m1) TaxID=1072389 RepID=K1XLW6_MARBU|nr:NADH-ubiquinone oxidoreductase subunit B17.2 [Drepanopeziza brunnea f. sp. 'multigermtubi' MB_m1]EKD13489.1 NADH-ubiquinone oxidoreductase subunit B17.2 [Drepanopeziza brunnea f. sp. 'multigermtubi' MB_m1]
MSTILRTLRNLRRVGLRDAAHQMQNWLGLELMRNAGDTKAGTLIAKDRYGNKYYENLEEELPLRTRWVDYKDYECDPTQIEPGWRAWMSYTVDKPPTQDPLLQTKVRPWELPDHRPNMTFSRAAYKPYSTVKPKLNAWTPVVAQRG